MDFESDIKILEKKLKKLPSHWDGRKSILELKEADYNWRQMEWWGFYFEYKVKEILKKDFQIPGEKFDNVGFDLKGQINWDCKASALNTNNQFIILNDKKAMDESIKKYKYHGEIIALCDVEYNDVNREFRNWHSEISGTEYKSNLSIYKYHITKVNSLKILMFVLNESNLDELDIIEDKERKREFYTFTFDEEYCFKSHWV